MAATGEVTVTPEPGEPTMTNAELDAAISRAANSTPFADLLAARGETTVVMDGDGALVVRHPDGRAAPPGA